MGHFKIMYIDDSPEDILIVTNVVQKVDGEVEVEPYSSGQEALDTMFNMTDESKFPNLILLDLNMPGLSGHQVLSRIKGHEHLRKIPVVVFTSSEAEEDVVKSYEEHASSVIIKPHELTDYFELFEEVIAYWKRWAASPLNVVGRRGA